MPGGGFLPGGGLRGVIAKSVARKPWKALWNETLFEPVGQYMPMSSKCLWVSVALRRGVCTPRREWGPCAEHLVLTPCADNRDRARTPPMAVPGPRGTPAVRGGCRRGRQSPRPGAEHLVLTFVRTTETVRLCVCVSCCGLSLLCGRVPTRCHLFGPEGRY